MLQSVPFFLSCLTEKFTIIKITLRYLQELLLNDMTIMVQRPNPPLAMDQNRVDRQESGNYLGNLLYTIVTHFL
jgi:hypothetical protein